MKKIVVTLLTFMVLTASAAWGQDAMHFYNLGRQSSMAYKQIRYFTKALQLNPNLVEAYEGRALNYYYQRKYDKAIKDYTKIIELKPHDPEAYRMLGLAQLKKENFDAAIDNLNRAIELDPRLASAYGYRAEAYRHKGMAEEALRDSTKAIHLRADPRTLANAYATRSKAYRQLGQDELSDADFDKSFELDPRYALYRYFASTASLEDVRGMGLFGIITVIFVGIFQLRLRAPNKSDLR